VVKRNEDVVRVRRHRREVNNGSRFDVTASSSAVTESPGGMQILAAGSTLRYCQVSEARAAKGKECSGFMWNL
jgi:hypothetical protein